MNVHEIDQIKNYLATNFIKCTKYNSNMDASASRYQTQPALIELSPDHKRLKITNRILVTTTQYTNECDTQIL